MDNESLWEILVPTVRNDGRPIRTRFHRVWDQKVRDISGGLTVLQAAKGSWISPTSGIEFRERMIPVRFIATSDEAQCIAEMTLTYYEQEAILMYEISRNVVLLHRT